MLEVIGDMTIREASNKIMRLENLKEYWLTEKGLAFQNTQPKAGKISGERVQGGTTRTDKNIKYLIECEEIDPIIKNIEAQLDNLNKYLENELKRLGEYEPIAKKVVELRDIHGKTWNQISLATGICPSYCRKMYKMFTGQRFVEL